MSGHTKEVNTLSILTYSTCHCIYRPRCAITEVCQNEHSQGVLQRHPVQTQRGGVSNEGARGNMQLHLFRSN